MREGGKQAIKADNEVVSVAELKALKRQVRELERLLAKKTMENEILKDALSLARGIMLISLTPLPFEDDIPMKQIAETLEVSRSWVAERKARPVRPRPTRYSKVEDENPLPLIRQIVDERLTYGYRRMCAVPNRRLEEAGRQR
ncbi:MAG: hypothetical protein R6W92_03425 [Desulfocurvibacter africanus]